MVHAVARVCDAGLAHCCRPGASCWPAGQVAGSATSQRAAWAAVPLSHGPGRPGPCAAPLRARVPPRVRSGRPLVLRTARGPRAALGRSSPADNWPLDCAGAAGRTSGRSASGTARRQWRPLPGAASGGKPRPSPAPSQLTESAETGSLERGMCRTPTEDARTPPVSRDLRVVSG